jgi:energy-coupling factor transport system ATP-binding protein
MISVNNVDYSYATTGEESFKALDGLSIDFHQGEFVAVIGKNGSGKSTLAKLLNALYVPDAGTVTVDGIDTGDESGVWEIRQKVGMVFQNPDNQIVATTVEEDVAFGPENLGLSSFEIRERIDRSLKMVGMEQFRFRQPHTLSGGQKQRVAIAGVIAMEPQYLVLDEPTAMLDPGGRQEIIDTVRYFHRQKGMGIIYVTHIMEEAIEADRVAVIDGGKLVCEGTPKEIFSETEFLRKLNLEVTPVGILADLLFKEGVSLSGFPLTIEEMVNELWPLLK